MNSRTIWIAVAVVGAGLMANGAVAQSMRFDGLVPPVCTVKTTPDGALSSELAVFCNVSDGATLYASIIGGGAQDYALVLDGQEVMLDEQSESVVRRYRTAVSLRETVVLRKRSDDTATPPQLNFRIVAGG